MEGQRPRAVVWGDRCGQGTSCFNIPSSPKHSAPHPKLPWARDGVGEDGGPVTGGTLRSRQLNLGLGKTSRGRWSPGRGGQGPSELNLQYVQAHEVGTRRLSGSCVTMTLEAAVGMGGCGSELFPLLCLIPRKQTASLV